MPIIPCKNNNFPLQKHYFSRLVHLTSEGRMDAMADEPDIHPGEICGYLRERRFVLYEYARPASIRPLFCELLEGAFLTDGSLVYTFRHRLPVLRFIFLALFPFLSFLLSFFGLFMWHNKLLALVLFCVAAVLFGLRFLHPRSTRDRLTRQVRRIAEQSGEFDEPA